MTLEEIKAMLETTGIPVAYRCFPEGVAPPLPFICYLTDGSDNFAADGVVYHPITRVRIELYTKFKEPEYEDKVERALSSIYWEKHEIYIDSEQCYQIVYEIEV